MQLFIRDLASATGTYTLPHGAVVSDLKALLEARQGLPSSVQGLVYGGRQLRDEQSLSACDGGTLQLVLRLRGGKGGFGNLLRGLGRDGNVTDNFDACRDLQGRRLRVTTNEQKILDWKAKEGERELERVALQHIKDQAKQAKKERAEVEDTSGVKEMQQAALASVQQAVADALASATAGAAAAGGKGSGAGSHGVKRPMDVAKDVAVAGKGKDSGGASGSTGTAASIAKKKSKMMAALEEFSSSGSDSETE